MDENDSLVTLFPTHEFRLVLHSSHLSMDGKYIEYMQRATDLALEMGLTPLAMFYEALPPMYANAEGIEDAVEEWASSAG